MVHRLAVPGIVARLLEENPLLSRPRSLADRNAFQAVIINRIADAHAIRGDSLVKLVSDVGAAYAEHVPHG